MPVPFSQIRNILSQSPNTTPVLVRSPKAAGYQAVVGISVVNYSALPLYPVGSAVAEDWLLWRLETLVDSGASGYVSVPTAEMPDLSTAMTTGGILSAIDAGYDAYSMAISYVGGIGRVSTLYRYGELTESSSKRALVFNFVLA